MQKEKWIIDREFLLKMGIDPANGVRYLEEKKVSSIDPVHVMALGILKEQPMIASNSSKVDL